MSSTSQASASSMPPLSSTCTHSSRTCCRLTDIWLKSSTRVMRGALPSNINIHKLTPVLRTALKPRATYSQPQQLRYWPAQHAASPVTVCGGRTPSVCIRSARAATGWQQSGHALAGPRNQQQQQHCPAQQEHRPHQFVLAADTYTQVDAALWRSHITSTATEECAATTRKVQSWKQSNPIQPSWSVADIHQMTHTELTLRALAGEAAAAAAAAAPLAAGLL
jgi:hypothetical protein